MEIKNKYIQVKDASKVYAVGKYVVGEDIEAGEYYVWGEGRTKLDIEIFGKNRCTIYEELDDCDDGYIILQERERMEITQGFITRVDNIIYTFRKSDILIPRHKYRVGYEIPQGRYKYWYKRSSDNWDGISFIDDVECVFDMYPDDYRNKGKFFRERGGEGKAETDILVKYVDLKNGVARLMEEGEFHPASGPERKQEERKLWERRARIEKEWNKKDNTSKIFYNDKIWYYFSTSGPVPEVALEYYFKTVAEIDKMENLSDDDFSHNYRVGFKRNDYYNQCLLLYMFKEKYIQWPTTYGINLSFVMNQILYHGKRDLSGDWDGVLNDINVFFDGDDEKYIRHYESMYPYRIWKNGSYYDNYIQKEDCIGFDSEEKNMLPRLYTYMVFESDVNYQEQYAKIVLELEEKGILSPKWKSEFSLYLLVKSYFPSAIYQYRTRWLKGQSLDIYVPELQLGVEYQGRQHYEAVEFFGGNEGLEDNQRRDRIKKEKCKEHGIVILEWDYNEKIEDIRLKSKFDELNLILPPKTSLGLDDVYYRKKEQDMRDIVEESNDKIYQYSLEGTFVAAYKNIQEASEKTGIKYFNIQRACKGFRDSAGGFQWRILDHESFDNIKPLSKNKNSTNEPQKVMQLDRDGTVIKEYNSIAEAVKATGINSKSIRDVINGKQHHAGGFLWKKSICRKNEKEE